MAECVSHPAWMRTIRDDVALTALSIPGTHNSCCVDVPLGIAETQNVDLPDQLNAGIRFLDIRLAHYQDNLFVHHDVVHMGKNYTDVLEICVSFLKKNPSEFIIMLVKEESRADSALGRLAPSKIIGKLFSGETTKSADNTRSFAETFKARTWEATQDNSLFYNVIAGPHGNNSETANPVLTSGTTSGELRGKIVLLRSFESKLNIGLDLTRWPENQKFRIATTLICNIEDRYQNPGDDDKFNFIVAHLEEAKCVDLRDLYITYSSAVAIKASGYSKAINPRLNDYLAGSPAGRVGIIVMDYFEQPPELVSNVINMNSRSIRLS